MQIGVDFRPALVNREGIGRYVRELVRALCAEAREPGADFALALFGATRAASAFGPAELGLPDPAARLVRWRLPSRAVLVALRAARRGVDDLLGGAALFHHTQYRRLPVRRAREVFTLHDLCYLDSAEYVDARTSRRMSEFARQAARATGAGRALLAVPTEEVRREVCARLQVPPERVFATPLGCDHAVRAASPAQSAPEAPFVLSVSRVDPRKNYALALRAFEELCRADRRHRWVIAGAPGYRSDEFAALLEASPVRARVDWRRAASDAELARLRSEAAVFLQTSAAEGFGLTPLEALASGLPVVCARHAVAREVLGEAVEWVAGDDPSDVASGLARVLGDPARASALARAGRARAALFPWSRTARATLAAYRALAELP